jgi:hypothetical protein
MNLFPLREGVRGREYQVEYDFSAYTKRGSLLLLADEGTYITQAESLRLQKQFLNKKFGQL